MEKFDYMIEFAPVILVVFMFLMHNKFFTTPVQLEKKHHEIIQEVQMRFASLVSVNELKTQFSDVKLKIDKIYEYFLTKNE